MEAVGHCGFELPHLPYSADLAKRKATFLRFAKDDVLTAALKGWFRDDVEFY